MAGTTTKVQPRPWHTASFYNARFAMLCVGVFANTSVGRFSFLFSVFSVLAFFDAVSIIAWRRNEIALPAPLTDGSVQSEAQKRALWWAIVAFLLFFSAVLLVATGLVPLRNYNNAIVQLVSFPLANYAGWHLLSWLREAFAIMSHYNTATVNRDAIYANAPLPVLSGKGNGGTP